MDFIQLPIKVARRRIIVQSFLDWLSRIGLIAFGMGSVAVLAAKFIVLPVPFIQWVAICLIAASALTLSFAIGFAWWFRPSRQSVATAIDQRMQLRERLSSASQLTLTERSTPMGQALWQDANLKAQRLDVRDAFPVRLNTHYARLFLPAAVIGFSFLLAQPIQTESNPSPAAALTVAQVKNSVEPLIQQVRKQREAAEKEKLADADLLKSLEAQLENLQSKPPKDAAKFMSELKNMQEQLEAKRKEMGTGDSLKKQLSSIKKMDNGPAEELADAMMNGDMEEASEQVEQMLEKLQKGELSKDDQKKLANQLKQMEKALEEAMKAHAEQKKQLEEQIKQAEAAGNKEKAAQLLEKLEQLKQSDADMKAAAELKEALAQAAENLAKGDQKAAAEAVKQMGEQLSKMAQNAKQAEALKELQQEMNNSKRSSTCSQCNGGGCTTCRSQSDKTTFSKNSRGQGKGAGERDEAKDDTSEFDSQVRGNVGQGETALGGKIGGENKKTPTQFDVREAILSAEVEEPDPIEHAKLPKRERDISKEYMDAIRTGK